MLSNIRPSVQHLKVSTNGGTQVSTFVGDLANFGTVWYNPASLANILSLAQVSEIRRVTMDTALASAIFVHRLDGSIMRFARCTNSDPCTNGLYFFDVAAAARPISSLSDTTSSTVNGYIFINTVAKNKERFHRREIAGADQAVILHRKIGRPSQAQFEDILRNNLIHNCPVTVDDARRAILIYGPDPATLKGKTTSKHSDGVPVFDPVHIPAPILDDHRKVTLAIDYFFVQGHPFLHTISRKIKFRTVATVEKRTKATTIKEMKTVLNTYNTRGFEVVELHADMEFECIQEAMRPTLMNLNARDDHVGEVERSIRTIKERVRADVHGMPFKRLPKLMIIALVQRAVKVLNQFPALDGVSSTLSPLTIMTGKPSPDYNTMKIEFGSYAQVFEDNDPTNTIKARTTGAIALGPTGNVQGDHYFMSLTSGKRLSRAQWTELPMPDAVIAAVEHRAAAEKQPLIVGGCPLFEWQPNQPIHPAADAGANVTIADGDGNEHDGGDDEANYGEENVWATGANIADATGTTGAWEAYNDGRTDPEAWAIGAENVVDDANDVLNDDWPTEIDNEAGNEIADLDETDGDGAESTAEVVLDEGIVEEPDTNEESLEDQGAWTTVPRYNLRSQRNRDYSHRLDQQMDATTCGQSYDPQHQLLQTGDRSNPTGARMGPDYIFGHIMTQMTATAGIKKHGQRAVDALLKEFCQLDDKSVFAAVDATKLSHKQKSEALRAINLIKEKRDGALKGRSCADGRPQRALYTKEQSASPTVSTDALMISLMIDAKERRDVATADVVGAYLLADMDEFVLLKLTGESVDIMCTVNDKYVPFVVIEHGKKVLYLQLLKALYGCVRSALLWYELFSTTLQAMGFALNPYDPCIANKVIEGSQCTIAWYVDDNKISHAKESVVTDIITKIEQKFGKMTVTRGKQHVFLSMDICFKDNGTLTICMKGYIAEAIAEFGEDVTRSATTPAGRNIFDVDANAVPLDKQHADIYHKVVAKLLYVTHRGRPDIQLAIAFMCTRVSCSTTQDWGKLKRLLQYLNRTVNDVLTIGADSLDKLVTWVDAAYGVHQDMKSHTGGAMSFGRGAVLCKSSKQKLNTKSSTEAELIGASDYLPNTIWVKMFLVAQGYAVNGNEFFQDNQSAMKLEKNGRASCGQKSRHIDIRYFFMKDRIKTEGIDVVYCPTEEMLADFFTKALQGSLFIKFKKVIMGEEHVSSLKKLSLAPAKERVADRGVSRSNKDVSSGANGRTSDDVAMTSLNRTYASVLKQGVWTRSSDAVEYEVLSPGKSDRAHSIE